MSKKIYYLGFFPPPYGGVTIKNKLLYDELSKTISIKAAKQSKKIMQIFYIVKALIFGDAFLVGSGSLNKNVKLTQFMYKTCRKKLNRSLNFIMGGTAAAYIADHPEIVDSFKAYKRLYVETQGMADTLQAAGLNNVEVYPNGRLKPEAAFYTLENTNKKLECVFFSLVTPEKGVDSIIETAKQISNVNFHFYGHIDKDFETAFLNEIDGNDNMFYHGVFTGNSENVYHELSKYDVLLLPTRWKHEGVPGILVESKIAGLPAVVSNIAYNAEIVSDGVSGIVLKENTAEALSKALLYLDENRSVLSKLKAGAKDSAEHYYIDNYIDGIIGELKE